MYKKATQDLPKLEKQLDQEWDKIPLDLTLPIKMTNKECHKKYDRIDLLESKIKSEETDIMIWIVSNRNALWT